MEHLIEIGNWFLNVGTHYPDLLALLVGSLAGYVFTMMMELYFLPISTDPVLRRRQQGYTFLLCWFSSALCSAVMWGLIDAKDPVRMRVSISIIFGVLSFAGYPFIAKLATSLYPKIGSAWRNGK